MLIFVIGQETGAIVAAEAAVPNLEVMDQSLVVAAAVVAALETLVVMEEGRKNFLVDKTCDAQTGILCLYNHLIKTSTTHHQKY